MRRLVLTMVVLGLSVVVGLLSMGGPFRHTPWLTRTRLGPGGWLWLLAVPALLGLVAWALARPRVK